MPTIRSRRALWRWKFYFDAIHQIKFLQCYTLTSDHFDSTDVMLNSPTPDPRGMALSAAGAKADADAARPARAAIRASIVCTRAMELFKVSDASRVEMKGEGERVSA